MNQTMDEGIPPGVIWFFVILILIGGAWAGFSIWAMSMEHAVSGHGNVAVDIKNACDNNPELTAQRDTDGRICIGAQYEDGKYGVTVTEADGEWVTSFPNKSKTLEALKKYFFNRGYK